MAMIIFLRDRIVVGQDVVLLVVRRRVLVAEADVQRQLVVHPPVVLQVGEVHPLAQVGDQDVAERVLAAEAEHEVGQVVDVVRGDARRPRELAGVGVAAVQRVDVLHLGRDVLVLVARLQRVLAHQPGVVDLRVPHRRVLPLRVGRLSAEVREPGDQLASAGRPRRGDRWAGR